MKMCAHMWQYVIVCDSMWQYIAEFFLKWEIFHTKVVQTTHILCSINISRKSRSLLDNVEKYGTAI
jgi:hypothetical protein